MFERLKEKFTPKMSNMNIKETILSDNDVIKIIEEIKNGANISEQLDKVQDECENAELSEIITNYVSSQVKPYKEMHYLRDLEFDEFKKIIEYMFKNTIIHIELEEVIFEKIKLDNDNATYIKKLLNTINEWIIIKRYSLGFFKQDIYDLFRFDDKKTDFLWKLFDENRQELVNIALLENIILSKKIEFGITSLIDVFSTLFDKEDDEDIK